MTTVLQNPIAEDLGAIISHLEMQDEALATPEVVQAKPIERKPFEISILKHFISLYDLREHIDRYHNDLNPLTVRAIGRYFIKQMGG